MDGRADPPQCFFIHRKSAAYAELLLRPVELSASRSINDKISRPTLLNLVCLDVPKLVHLGCLTSDNALGEFDSAANSCAPADGVLCSLAGDLDEANARVLRATIVLAVTKVTEPGLESGRVELLHAGTVGLDGSGAGDAGPLAGVVEESKVDLGVLLEVVGLAGLGVGVEDEVNAVVLLRALRQWVFMSFLRMSGDSPLRLGPCICWPEDRPESW